MQKGQLPAAKGGQKAQNCYKSTAKNERKINPDSGFNPEAKDPSQLMTEWQFQRVRVISKNRYEYEGELVNIDEAFSKIIRCHP